MRALWCCALACALLLAGAGCPGPGYPRCKGDEHCKDRGEVCVYGQCYPCALDSHCPQGRWCNQYKCDSQPRCSSDGDCANNRVCKNGQCSVECTADAECAAGSQCKDNRCVMLPGKCVETSDCGTGEVCRAGGCVVPQPGDPEYEALYGAADAGPPSTAPSGVDITGDRALCGTEVRVYFAFNEAMLNEDARAVLEKAAQCVKANPELSLVVQGHTDERGSTELNLALGERRAISVRNYLTDLGVPETRMGVVSVGEERPLDPGHDEVAWAKNRRAEVLPRAP